MESFPNADLRKLVGLQDERFSKFDKPTFWSCQHALQAESHSKFINWAAGSPGWATVSPTASPSPERQAPTEQGGLDLHWRRYAAQKILSCASSESPHDCLGMSLRSLQKKTRLQASTARFNVKHLRAAITCRENDKNQE